MTDTASTAEEVAAIPQDIMTIAPDRAELADLLARHRDKDVRRIARKFVAWWAKKGDGAAMTLRPFENWLAREAPLPAASSGGSWPRIEAALRETWGRAYVLEQGRRVFMRRDELDEIIALERERIAGDVR